MSRLFNSRLLALGLTLAMLVPMPAQALTIDDFDLPRMGSSSGGINAHETYELGRTWLRQFRARAPLWQDPITQHYVESLIGQLLPYSNLPGIDPVVTLVDSRQLNAFAVPGGVIGVNTGLFSFAKNESELASVLAHELGHLSQHHFARRQARAEETQLPTMAAMLAGMLLAVGGGGDAGIAAAMGSQAAFIQDQLTYSRRYEEEADRVGLQAMAQAGFDPGASVDMFRSMQRLMALQGGNPPEFLLTHPVTQSRISDVQSRVAQIGSPGSAGVSDPRHALVRARALLEIHRDDPTQAASQLAQDSTSEAARRYLEALIQAERGNTQAALNELDQLARELPDLPMIPTSAAQVAYETGRPEQALERIRRLLRLMPNYYPAEYLQAQALLGSDPGQAFTILRRLSERRPEDPQIFDLLAVAAGRSGQPAWGHLARAETLQLTGRIDQAIRQLEVAKDVAEQQGDTTALSRIKIRRDAFLDYRESLEDFR
ncbi:M48 family metalloprotease [Pistricoccus aurantiacus]|uniref:Putative beta-barrel assembly-enhancing protease n=1 Tax=Pistricoccus aurantiacus TaxID=1883414 RepID=A0A5B8SVR6_9GAMM|nr:M48 family metalloprotease [Pistricoccus aurantiacus]QEA39013.1 M48 family metalloprotease [Pistricoccus aurantiacus]